MPVTPDDIKTIAEPVGGTTDDLASAVAELMNAVNLRVPNKSDQDIIWLALRRVLNLFAIEAFGQTRAEQSGIVPKSN
jgi:hypothetical protein